MTSPAPASGSSSFSSSAHLAFQDAHNDVIIRSSDGKIYPFRKLWLACASPVFESMFEIGLKNEGSVDPTEDQLPVVEISEDGKMVEMLLIYAHPQECSLPAYNAEELVRCVLRLREV